MAHCFEDKVSKKTVNTIKGIYERLKCPVAHEGKLTDFFKIARLRQGYTLSLTLFLLVSDSFMNKVIKGKKRGTKWRMMGRLEDLESDVDICLLA